MFDRPFDCLCGPHPDSVPVHAVRPAGLDTLIRSLSDPQAHFLRQSGFAATAGAVGLLPGCEGVAGAVLGLGDGGGPFAYGALPYGLPEGMVCRLDDAPEDTEQATLGFCLGAYAFTNLRTGPGRAPARLALDYAPPDAISAARATWLVRDLVNTPANLLGPAELAEAAVTLLESLRAECFVTEAAALANAYPLIAAVGQGSARAPRVVVAKWRAPGAAHDAPLVSICGKGVCFDTGGYNLKPAAGMLRMKKDMAGAAVAIGLARMIIEAELPLRLEVRLGCVENSISGNALRPLDVVRSRRGLTVAVGNTDAEGRLVLADLLAEASDQAPALLLDFATLTGAARVALGPDLPAMFCNDDRLAEEIATAARAACDPVWRLPLWDGYNYMLEEHGCDLNNVSDKPYAGAIVAALFLQRFVATGTNWAHFDIYAWNDGSRPGRPEGGEAQAMRAAFAVISRFVHVPGIKSSHACENPLQT